MEKTIFSGQDQRRLERAADHYLLRCYRDQTAARVTEFAQYLELTQPYLSRYVAAITGLSVRDFLRRRQLGYASYLLQAAPTLSIRAVAVASGFGTPSTFHRCFKAAYGSSPAAYREVMKCDTSKEILAARGVTPIRIGKVMKCE